MSCSPKYLIEPLMVFFMFAYIAQFTFMSGTYQADTMFDISKNETLVRYCLYHKEDSTCRNLTEAATTPVSVFNMNVGVVSSFAGVVSSVVVGYIADRVSRKAIFISACFSVTFMSSVLLANSLVFRIPLYTYYIASILQYFGGGMGAFLGVTMAYISDISDEESRTSRIAIADGMIQLGSLFGALVAGELMTHCTWYSTPLMSTVTSVLIAFYLMTVIKDPPQTKKPASHSVKELCLQLLDVYIAPSPYKKRIYILSVAYLLHFTAFLSFVAFITGYLLNAPFDWSAAKIGVLHTVGSVSNFVMVMAVPLMEKVRMPETLIACISCLFCCVGFGVATVGRTFAILAVGRVLQGGSGVALAIYRARLSKLVKPNQYGQLFLLLNACEGFSLVVSSIGLYQIYLATRKWFNGFTFTLLIIIQFIALLLTLWDGWLARIQSREASKSEAAKFSPEEEPLLGDTPEEGKLDAEAELSRSISNVLSIN